MVTLRADGSWPSIDYQEQRRSAWTPVGHLGNVLLMARAYRSAGSKLSGSTELQNALDAALDYWLEHDFQNSNWWWNQIGVPRSLAPVLLLMEDELSDAQRGKGLEILRRARIGMTGQNLVWVTEITALRGILEQDPKLVASAYRRIAEEIRVDMKEGIQPDFSFHQHGPCLYSHGYGAAFAVDCSRIAMQVAGTRLAFPPEKITLLSSLLLDGSQWMSRGGTSDFGAEGREISRKGQDAGYLATAARNMLELPTGREDEFRALAGRASDGPAPPLEGNRHFWRSDVMTHHRADYYTSARMFSSRIANTDDPCNSEGLRSHHIADGCNVLVRTGNEYRDVFPVWDWQKIPGTTVEQKEQLTGSPRTLGKKSFVGGVSDGVYGLAAFDLVRGALSARKSWFFFDREYVCLGAGITCGSENPVVTTLNQCNLRGSVSARNASQVQELASGVHSLDSPAWVWHDSIGYVFLGPARIGLANQLQRGNWWRINHRYAKDEVAREMFTAWIEHGSAPGGVSYAYIVVSGVDRASVETYATAPPLDIVANRAGLQAVWHAGLNVLGGAFYDPGQLEIR
ncbi:polysaccharide lyase family 8 super-sandwich domain-containing protein, partial [Planctomycetota bacterium]